MRLLCIPSGDWKDLLTAVDGQTITYDSWGNVLSATGELATINPFRYRGYYYDNESWFYYLQSRYYDPAIGRFINADAFASTGQSFIGYNMFAYCGNSPVSNVDCYGTKYRAVGIGIQFEVSVDMGKATECVGVEVIVYWDQTVCGEDKYVVAIYVYEGGSLSLDQLSAIYSNALEMAGYLSSDIDNLRIGGESAAKGALAALSDNWNGSLSGVLIWGNEEFTTSKDYEGLFTSCSGSYKHAKGTYAWSKSCIAVSIGGSVRPSLGISFGLTYYTQIYSSQRMVAE